MTTSTIAPALSQRSSRMLSAPEDIDPRWSALYTLGGAAAMLAAIITPIAIAAFIIWPPPLDGTAAEWLDLFQRNWMRGLLGLDLLLIPVLILQVPILLALYLALRRVNEPVMLVTTVIGLIGIALHLSSNTAFEMLSLSRDYAAAATDSERALFLAAGEAMLATYEGTAFHLNYVLGQLVAIVLGFIMLRTTIFNRTTAYLGIGSNMVGFGLYLPEIGLMLSALSGVGIWVWYILIAKRLFELKRMSAAAS